MKNSEKIIEAIKYIGASVQTYHTYHFLEVPDRNNRIREVYPKITRTEFLELVYEYYNDDNRIREDEVDVAKNVNDCKRFVKERVNDDSYKVGLEWLDENKEFLQED